MGAGGIHSKHRERVRNEFLKNGFPDGTPEHKNLEMLLFYGIPRKDTNELAHELINHFGSLAAVLDASPADLMKIDGVGKNTASLLKLIMPVARCYMTDKKLLNAEKNNHDTICNFITGKYCGFTEEVIAVTSLNNRGNIVGFDIIGNGDVSSANVSIRKLISAVLERNATAVVISHNHPDGNALPSEKDIEATVKIKQALDNINVQLLDHVIVVTDDYVSLAVSEKFIPLFR